MKTRHQTIWVDFKNKEIIKVKTKMISLPKSRFDFSHFNPVPQDSNFADFSDQDRFEYSEHILSNLKDCSFDDLIYWVDMGMLDKKKLSASLNLFQEKAKKSKK